MNRQIMMYHILNGDALSRQLEGQLPGPFIVAKECLVDGPVNGDTPAALYAVRAKFLSIAYGTSDPHKYYEKVVPQFEKVKQIKPGAEVVLWFEEDLFCQVNSWFVLHLLKEEDVQARLSWVLPTADLQYGFGGMDTQALLQAYHNRTPIDETDFKLLSELWPLYQNDQIAKMLAKIEPLQQRFPFLPKAIAAHRDRIPRDNHLGRPKEALLAIMRELGTQEFGPVFRAFSQRESIYGFGNLQVKRLLDELRTAV